MRSLYRIADSVHPFSSGEYQICLRKGGEPSDSIIRTIVEQLGCVSLGEDHRWMERFNLIFEEGGCLVRDQGPE